ncbi:MAG: FecR domain-containing protein [Bryobacterales bacterium]|nr:FecR domain-containing protein [Bryobacterales bacterium]
MTDERFDELLKEMRHEGGTAGDSAGARERVWRKLAGSTSIACGEFRPQLGDYLAGRLTASRRLLADDHLGRCADCRRALAEAKGERKVIAMPELRPTRWPNWARGAVAAGVLLAVTYLGSDRIDSALAPSGPRATVVSVAGNLQKLPTGALQPGATLLEGDVVRTTADSRAVLQLADGSRVEMNQRTEIAVQGAWSGNTIQLDRGDIIVEAAGQRRGRLRVATRDSVASVKGTIFAVSSGTAGSLVSVVEGSVEVSKPGSTGLVAAGKQAATSRALEQVSISQAISWSDEKEKYFSLLAGLVDIEKQLAAMPGPAARTEAKLLPYLPADTLVYFAIPNLDGTIREALRLMDQRARENETLNEWWSSERGQRLRDMLYRIQAITPLLGAEVVFVVNVEVDATGNREPAALLMAHIQPDRQDSLRDAIARLMEGQDHTIPYRISQDLLLISGSETHLEKMAARLGGGASSPFAAEIASRYERGVSWLAAIDTTAFGAAARQGTPSRLLGLSGMRYLLFEQGSGGSRDELDVTLSFEGARTGMASWLAAPGSAGSAEYISSEAIAAFSGSTRDPRQAFDEMLAVAGEDGPLLADLRQFEAGTGIDIGADIASSLGTDFSFVIERATLPAPGWVAVLEVMNPGALDDSARRLVDAFNRRLPPDQASRQGTLSRETVDGRTWMTLRSAGTPASLYWTYDRGYLIASMDRALAIRAIAIRDAGSSLKRSAEFRQWFPVNAGLHNSGFLWFNANGVVGELASLTRSPAVARLLDSRDPVLVVVDGETERIHAASRTRLTKLLLDLMLVHGAANEQSGGDTL